MIREDSPERQKFIMLKVARSGVVLFQHLDIRNGPNFTLFCSDIQHPFEAATSRLMVPFEAPSSFLWSIYSVTRHHSMNPRFLASSSFGMMEMLSKARLGVN
jgi:hypothetical protein